MSLKQRWKNDKILSRVVKKNHIKRKTENPPKRPERTQKAGGHTGVAWDKSKRKWGAKIQIGGKAKFLGRYTDIEKAIKARIDCHVRSTEAPAAADSSGYFRGADGSCLVYRIGV